MIDVLMDSSRSTADRVAAAHALAGSDGAAAVSAFVAALTDPRADGELRRLCALILRDRTAGAADVARLCTAVADRGASVEVRVAAVNLLSGLADPSEAAVSALGAVATDSANDADVRRGAMNALVVAARGGPACLGPLVGVLTDAREGYEMREAAADALRNVDGADAIAVLAEWEANR